MSEKKHHYLVVGEIVYTVKDTDNIHALRLNAVILGDTDDTIPARVIGAAQQALQMQFHQRMDDPSVTVRDVVIMGMLYLGFMTQEEFQKVPNNTVKQEMDDEAVKAAFGDALH